MHVPVQPHEHRCSHSEYKVVRPTMLGESSLKLAENKLKLKLVKQSTLKN